MFVYTVEARTSAPEDLRQHVFIWPAEVGRHAAGWLGNTAGVSANGQFILLMRFESEEAAFITSDLPQSAKWWQVCRGHVDTEPVFTDSTTVIGVLSGGSDDAARVRVTRGRASPQRFRSSIRGLEALPVDERPGLIGGLVSWHEHDNFTEALYFRSPASQESITHRGRQFLLHHDTSIREPQEFDVQEPWLTSRVGAR